MRIFFRSFILLIGLICNAIIANTATNTTQLLVDIKAEFAKRILEPSLTLKDDELFCECNVFGCDKEITDVIGTEFAGVCRAYSGGACYRSVTFNDDGDIRKVALSCIASVDLVPPGRPFVCETVRGANKIVECCSKSSLCNEFELSKIRISRPLRDGNLRWVILVCVIAVVFSAVGLMVGIFWCRADRAKEIAMHFLRLLIGHGDGKPLKRSVSANFEGGTGNLKGLLDDLDSTIGSSGSGAGVPMLIEQTISNQITLYNIIGEGRFGEVFLGEWRGDKVAVKIFMSREEASWNRETEIYRTNMLRHSNLLRWISSDCKDTGTDIQLWLITEYCPLGSLYEYLGDYEINQVLAVQLIRSCVLGLSYLHTEVSGISHGSTSTKPAIAHRDIKSRNILLRSDMTCVIADLGLAVRCIDGEIDLPSTTRAGTVRYSAPELLAGTYAPENFDAYVRMDIYALALVIWEVCRRVVVDDASAGASFGSSEREGPYYEYVRHEPTLTDMHECVCVQRRRPTVRDEWQTSPIMRELIRIMCECWSSDPNARLPSLNIRFALEKLIQTHDLKIVPD